MLWQIQAEPAPLQECIGLSGEPRGDAPAEEVEQLTAEIRAWFQSHNPVHIDGVRVLPEVRRVELPVDDPEEDGWFTVAIDLVYPLEVPARSVSFLWESFAGTDWMGEEYVPILVKEPGNSYMVSLWEGEPEYVWHPPTAPARERPRVTVVEGDEEVHVWSSRALLLVLVGGVLLAGSWRRGAGKLAMGGGALLITAGGVFWMLDAGLVRRVRLPAQEQALELFETLHGNVYAAFDARTEEGIYEVLSKSLADSILDQQYVEIYESMILREEGGAVCSVDEVEVLERAVTLEPRRSEEGAYFEIDWTWNVRGSVAHWGHIHRRTNRYRALYTVRHDGTAWKIAEVSILEHSRVEE